MASKAALVVPALKKQTATIIMAHGLGDSGAGWVSLAENWRRRGKFEDVKFIFPNAPSIPITINGGYIMPGWYDIVRRRENTSFSELNQVHDEVGILRSRDVMTKFITDEVAAGIPSERIILGGFSQGGAMSIFTGITTPHKLGGVFGLSCYLVMGGKIKELAKVANEVNKDTPFFMGHGDADELVQLSWGEQTADFLKKNFDVNVEFKTYRNLAHSAALEEINDVEKFINQCLPDLEKPSGQPAGL